MTTICISFPKHFFKRLKNRSNLFLRVQLIALQTDMFLRGINVYLFFKIMCSVTLLIAD